MAEKNTPKKKDSTLLWMVILFGGLIIWAFIWANRQEPSPTSTFESNLTDLQVVDPATVSFIMYVKNTGNVEDTPLCNAKIQSPSGEYHGQDLFSPPKSLKPGESTSFKGMMTITGQGAAYVTKTSFGCS